MFGVTVGFSLFLVWQQYDAAQKSAESEAATVEELYGLAGVSPNRSGAGGSGISPGSTPASSWRRSGP
jgi:hypothetical protein